MTYAVCFFCGLEKELKDGELIFFKTPNPMVQGGMVYLCTDCIVAGAEILKQEEAKLKQMETENVTIEKLPTPLEIKLTLDEYIIGQDQAKEFLAIAVYNHYCRISGDKNDDVTINKSNVLMIGPTGCGKTLLAQTLAKILRVPFTVADATALTEAGYVGGDVEDVLVGLLHDADWKVEEAEKGIIYIDEIDKLASKSTGGTGRRDVSGTGVQHGLLKMLEGGVVSVPFKGIKRPDVKPVQIDTTNILFILGGAFSGLEQIIKQRRNKKAGIGFGSDVSKEPETDVQAFVTADDLLQYGMVPEFLGRIPVLATLNTLRVKELVRILVEPRNSLIMQYTKLLAVSGVKLKITDKALKTIAQKSIEAKAGARGLRGVIEKAMRYTLFNLPSNKSVKECIITSEVIDKGNKPIIVYGD